MKNFLTLSVLILLVSCKDGSQKTQEVSDVMTPEWYSIECQGIMDKAQKGDKPYSSFATSIEYLTLETSSKSLIGEDKFGIMLHTLTDSIVIADMKLFNRKDGKYIGDLMQKGRANNEYLYPEYLTASDARREVYVIEASKKKIYVVGYDRKYKGHIDFEPIGYPIMHILGDNHLFIGDNQMFIENYCDYAIIDLNTKEVVSKRRSSALINMEDPEKNEHCIKYSTYCRINKNAYWRYKDDIRYYDCLTDTIYNIDTNLQVRPIGILDIGKLKITKEQELSRRQMIKWFVRDVVETSEEIITSLFPWSLPDPTKNYEPSRILIYSKIDNTTKMIIGDYSNDLDNGVTFPFKNSSQCESSIKYGFISAVKVKDMVQNRGEDAYTSVLGQSFKRMADALDYEANEIVGILHVK
ncbi:MAG: 6-bladed beta-propeller [Marinifilaceae bacterium]